MVQTFVSGKGIIADCPNQLTNNSEKYESRAGKSASGVLYWTRHPCVFPQYESNSHINW